MSDVETDDSEKHYDSDNNALRRKILTNADVVRRMRKQYENNTGGRKLQWAGMAAGLTLAQDARQEEPDDPKRKLSRLEEEEARIKKRLKMLTGDDSVKLVSSSSDSEEERRRQVKKQKKAEAKREKKQKKKEKKERKREEKLNKLRREEEKKERKRLLRLRAPEIEVELSRELGTEILATVAGEIVEDIAEQLYDMDRTEMTGCRCPPGCGGGSGYCERFEQLKLLASSVEAEVAVACEKQKKMDDLMSTVRERAMKVTKEFTLEEKRRMAAHMAKTMIEKEEKFHKAASVIARLSVPSTLSPTTSATVPSAPNPAAAAAAAAAAAVAASSAVGLTETQPSSAVGESSSSTEVAPLSEGVEPSAVSETVAAELAAAVAAVAAQRASSAVSSFQPPEAPDIIQMQHSESSAASIVDPSTASKAASTVCSTSNAAAPDATAKLAAIPVTADTVLPSTSVPTDNSGCNAQDVTHHNGSDLTRASSSGIIAGEQQAEASTEIPRRKRRKASRWDE